MMNTMVTLILNPGVDQTNEDCYYKPYKVPEKGYEDDTSCHIVVSKLVLHAS